ncbi:MAG: hypothetical protein DRP74_05980 [Candidatus Omnitrophota bacterium]|nr:MAG: hypothetical protein DRP74_05980 [Candidatus Omnitrophota bacterium]
MLTQRFKILYLIVFFFSVLATPDAVLNTSVQQIKHPNVAGTFYPDDPQELSGMIDGFLDVAQPKDVDGEIFALICPHAGYGYSGQVAAYGYKLVSKKDYRTVIVIAPSHYFSFKGVSVYPEGFFRTPLGDLEVDKELAAKILYKSKEVYFKKEAFEKEHAIEVQLPFIQKTLPGSKILPIVMGDCQLQTCKDLARIIKQAISGRSDVLLIVSSDLYHGFDYQEAEVIDDLTLSYLKKMDAEGLYNGLHEGKLQMCGGLPAVATLILAKELGHEKLEVLTYTNSANVTGKKNKGIWTVGYASCVIDQQEIRREQGKEEAMLNKEQRKKLLDIARESIQHYLKTGRKLDVTEHDQVLLKEMGAFVTLHTRGELRGCIGNIIGNKPLYLTIRDMAVESATGDPRFAPVELDELKDIDIEISVLTPLERISDPGKIKLGTHGVLIKKGMRGGVFLPQVATETGWSKDEFLSNLCAHKAGLAPDAWKDKATEIYIFSADVFSEK